MAKTFSSRQGGRSVKINNLREVLGYLDEVETSYLDNQRKQLRRYTKILATSTVIPALKEGAAASGVPIASRMADTARVKSDIYVVVKIGTVNPKLSGFRRGVGAKKSAQLATRRGGSSKSSQSYRTTLAWGSDKGPHPSSDVNHYAVGRSDRGYWVLPTLAGPLFTEVRDKYVAYLQAMIRKYGMNR